MNFVDLAALTIHDVKNRLAILGSRAEERGDRETMREAHEAAATLTRLLALYKAENDGLGIEIEARAPEDLLNELAAEIRQQDKLPIDVDLSTAPTLGFYDENLVKMVLLDALYNALRHARQQITLRATQDNDWLSFEVRDDGPGYPPAMLGKDAAMAAISREGTGLGLHLAGKIAALHCNGEVQGEVRLANENGAVFSLRLPK
ncbi:MAG: ATP-binding protein [Azonexus sp.]